MSKRVLVVALASAVLTWSAAAQTSASSQTSVSGSNETSVSASHSGAQVDSSTSINASQSTELSHKDNGKPKGSKNNASAADGASHAASASAGKSSATLASGTTINAVLTKSVDARHAKAGDEVTAKVTDNVKSDGKVAIAKGSKLVGHVTEAKAREKGEAGAQSSLGIVFDHAVLKNGQQVPTPVVIQALAAAQSNAAASAAMDEPMGATPVAMGGARAGGGLVSGVGSAVGGAAGAAGTTAGDVGRSAGSVVNTSGSVAGSAAGNAGGALSAGGQLSSHSMGVIGLHGLQLASDASSAAQGSVITSAGKTVHLDSGTQMLLRVTSEAAATK